jgi:hypothetical protein
LQTQVLPPENGPIQATYGVAFQLSRSNAESSLPTSRPLLLLEFISLPWAVVQVTHESMLLVNALIHRFRSTFNWHQTVKFTCLYIISVPRDFSFSVPSAGVTGLAAAHGLTSGKLEASRQEE